MDVLSYTDWTDAGGTRAALARQLADGTMVRLRRGRVGAGSAPGIDDLHLARMAATAPYLGCDTFLSHCSAAVLHKLPVLPQRLAEVTVVRTAGGHGQIRPTIHARLASLTESEVTEIDGLPATSLSRTVQDLVKGLPFPEAVMVADAALARGLRRDQLLLATASGRGCRMARRALQFADPRSESPGESLSRVRLHQSGVPAPELQRDLRDIIGAFLGRGDFYWPDQRLVGEYDGMVKYGRLVGPGGSAEAVIRSEKRREGALTDAGYRVVRWTWEDLWPADRLGRRLHTVLRN